MTHKNILVLAIRIAAIILMLEVIESIPDIYYRYSENLFPDPPVVFLISLLPTLIMLLLALFFWIFPTLLITSIVPDSEKIAADPEHYKNLYFAFIAAIGFYIFIQGVLDTFYFVALNYYINASTSLSTPTVPSNQAGFISSIFQLLFGLILILGHKGISKLIHNIRYSN